MSLAGMRVFIVEDETMILIVLEDSLATMGFEVVASALELDEALAKAAQITCDVAVLDINIAGRSVEPVANLLESRGIPFVFASGYGRAALPVRHSGRPLLTKPYNAEALRAALLKVLAKSEADA